MSISNISKSRKFEELFELKCLSTSETLARAWEVYKCKKLEMFAELEEPTRKDSRGSGGARRSRQRGETL